MPLRIPADPAAGLVLMRWARTSACADASGTYVYTGCFVDKDGVSNRDMQLLHLEDGMTPRRCHELCASAPLGALAAQWLEVAAGDSAAFGLQYGEECWCGTSQRRYGQAPEAECDMPCAGSHAPALACCSCTRGGAIPMRP